MPDLGANISECSMNVKQQVNYAFLCIREKFEIARMRVIRKNM